MGNNSQLVQAEVDKELKKLEKRYRNGQETKQIYKLKSENLNTIKDLVIKGSKEWEKDQET